MTFSRPATGPVNALFRPARPNRIEVDRRVVTRGATGRLLDFSNPEQAGRNAASSLQELSTFLKGVISTNGPLQLAAGLDLNANLKEFGRLTADPAFMDAYRSGDEGVRAQVNALRPEVSALAGQANAKAARLEYQEILLTEVTRDPLLKERPSGLSDAQWREKRAERFAVARETAADKSKLTQIQPEFLATEAPAIEIVDSQVKAQIYKNLAISEKKNQDDAYTRGFGAELRELSYGVANANRDEGLTPEQRNELISNSARAVWQAQLAKLSPFRVTSEIADIAWGSISNEVIQASADGSSAGVKSAISMLALFDIMARQSDVKLPGGMALGDYRFEDGSTIQSRIAGLRTRLDGELEKAKDKELWSTPELMQMVTAAAMGQLPDSELPKVYAAIGQLVAMGDGNAKDIAQINQLLSSNAEIGRRVREQLELPQVATLVQEMSREGRTAADVQRTSQQISDSNLEIATKIRLYTMNKSSPNDSLGGISRARAYLGLEIEKSGETIAQAWAEKKAALIRANNQKAAGLINPDPKKEASNTAIAATKMTEQRVAEIEAKGGRIVSDDEYRAIFRNELNAVTNSRLRQIGATQKPQQKSYAQEVTEEVEYVQQKLKENGGQRATNIFPPSVVEFAKQKGYPQTYPGLQRAMIERMKAATEPDPSNQGQQKKVFENPGEAWRKIFDNARQGGGPQSSVPTDNRRARALSEVATYAGIGGPDLPDAVLEVSGNAPVESSPRRGLRVPAPSDQRSTTQKTQGGSPEVLVGAALNMAVGVKPVAQQADGTAPSPSEVVAMSLPGLKILNDIYKGVKTMTTNTPVLPQASAGGRTGQIPLAIKNDKHPYFIAIGINEGTRTADGGYTRNYFGHRDPGDGAANRGTVSARSGTPQQADRQWAGILTQVATNAAPILKSLGLQEGTVGFNRVMFNILDLRVQAPAALADFIKKIPNAVKAGATVEAIAKARADSYINPATGRLETTFGSYDRLLRDQRSRAGAYDYKKRL